MHFSRRTLLAALALAPASFATEPVVWRALRPGLDHARLKLAASIGDGWLHAVRIDPARFRFRLLVGAATGDAPLTARQWAKTHDLVAATNAGMFLQNGLPVGFAKADGRVLQPAIGKDKTVLVFDDAHARLLDRDAEPFAPADHANAMQGIRMIASGRRNVWAQQPRIWSTACLAQDADGRILFLHLRSPLSVHDFGTRLLAAPLRIARCMYLEGGPEASLFASGGAEEIERFGSYETGFIENDDVRKAWPLPNVLGVAARRTGTAGFQPAVL